MLYVSDSEDAPSDFSADTSSASDSDTSDDYDGWNVNTGVLTLVHDDKPADWNPNTNYSANAFVWYNNRVWKNESGAQITGGTGLKVAKHQLFIILMFGNFTQEMRMTLLVVI